MKQLDLSHTIDDVTKHCLNLVKNRLKATENRAYYTEFQQNIDEMLETLESNPKRQRDLLLLMQSVSVFTLINDYGKILGDIDSLKKVLEVFIPTKNIEEKSNETTV